MTASLSSKMNDLAAIELSGMLDGTWSTISGRFPLASARANVCNTQSHTCNVGTPSILKRASNDIISESVLLETAVCFLHIQQLGPTCLWSKYAEHTACDPNAHNTSREVDLEPCKSPTKGCVLKQPKSPTTHYFL